MSRATTPWGFADDVTQIAPGITCYNTPSHGGYLLSAERRAEMPEALRKIPTFAGGNWYEEDCDWAIVALAFPQYFPPNAAEAARSTMEWMRANSERFANGVQS